MRKLLISALVLLALFFSACESTSVVEPLPTQKSTSIEYKGGLNTTFDSGTTEFQGKARIVQLDLSSYRLDVQITARSESENIKEQGNILFRFQFESTSGELPLGNYIAEVQGEDTALGQGDYQLYKGLNSFARYSFTGSKLSLKVESNESGRLAGRFLLNLDQRSGERMLDGQLEIIELASPVIVAGYFDLEVEQ